MDVSNIVVMLITAVAVIYSLVSSVGNVRKEVRDRRGLLHREEHEDEEEPLFEKPITPPPVLMHVSEPITSVVEHTTEPALNEVVKKLSTKKMLWIAHEIVSPPLALRPPLRQPGYFEGQR